MNWQGAGMDQRGQMNLPRICGWGFDFWRGMDRHGGDLICCDNFHHGSAIALRGLFGRVSGVEKIGAVMALRGLLGRMRGYRRLGPSGFVVIAQRDEGIAVGVVVLRGSLDEMRE